MVPPSQPRLLTLGYPCAVSDAGCPLPDGHICRDIGNPYGWPAPLYIVIDWHPALMHTSTIPSKGITPVFNLSIPCCDAAVRGSLAMVYGSFKHQLTDPFMIEGHGTSITADH